VNPYRRLLRYLYPYRWRYALALLGTACFTGLMAAPPLVLRHLVNEIVKPGQWEWLVPILAAFAFLPLLARVVQFFSMKLLLLASQRFLGDVRLAMYSHVLNLSMRFHGDYSGGMLVSRIMSDINMLQQLLQSEAVRLIMDSVIFIFAAVAIFYISPVLGAVFVVMIVLYVVCGKVFAKRIRVATQAYRSIYDQVAGRLQETVEGVRQVRIYNREEFENEAFVNRMADSLDRNYTGRKSSINLNVSLHSIAGYGSTFVYCTAGVFIVGGSLELGDLLAADMYVWMAITPAMRLASMVGELSEVGVSVRRIAEVLGEPHELESPPGAPRLARGRGAVEFRKVHFAYDPHTPLYRGLNLRVEPGQTVALVGHTGCGKTTLTQLLMRYWDIQKGEILIDGVNIAEVDLQSLRDIFGVVLQDPVVFEGTIAENIAYGCPAASREQVVAAARAAELDETIESFTDGYETILGTEGVRLSMGQKQRLSIARAIIRDPVILVMDEATSSLDSESEALIQRALEKVLEGRTSFVIAHRLSTITGADLIVVMDDGAIVETGTHEELMDIEGGLYQKFYEELRSGTAEDQA
jgi:subfamily B ATP-binding cassette protein MsbA